MSDPTRREAGETRAAMLLDATVCLDLAELARSCGASVTFVEELVLEGVLAPRERVGFTGDDVTRVRRVMRLQRDFDATLPSAALILDLLDEVQRLRGELRRLGG